MMVVKNMYFHQNIDKTIGKTIGKTWLATRGIPKNEGKNSWVEYQKQKKLRWWKTKKTKVQENKQKIMGGGEPKKKQLMGGGER